MSQPVRARTPAERRELFGLSALFAAIYFIQGIGEPTEGLIAQPLRSLLVSWGHSATEIAAFSALLTVPWIIKPLYGLITDFVPIAGYHRRSYMLVMSVAASVGLIGLYFEQPSQADYTWLLAVLMVPAVGIAFCDVVADALMVEKGRPGGITGQLQSIQWAALYAATIVTGFAGGYLSQHGQQSLGFLICALFTTSTAVLTLLFVREAPRPASGDAMKIARKALVDTLRTPAVWAAAAFLFLWSFNPFSASVLYLHMTGSLGLSEQFYGNTVSLMAVSAVAASVAYYFYCRRVQFELLIHLCIVLGILSTLTYWALSGPVSALWIALVVGLVYMTGTLIQLDLAARICPPETAGTTFALLMAVSNLGYSLSAVLGGSLYDGWVYSRGAEPAFNLLVVPWLRRQLPGQPLGARPYP